MYLHNFLSKFFGTYIEYTWTIHGIFILLIATTAYWLQRKTLKKLHARFVKTAHIWDDSFIQAFSLPISLLIWILAITQFSEFILIDLHQSFWAKELIRIRIALIILILIWGVWRYINQVEHRLTHPEKNEKKVDANTVSIIGHMARIGLGLVAGLILLASLGIPISGVLAFGGGGAIVMGIAAQQLLANWFGGLIIFMEKPFKLGEWIQSPDRNIEGVVTRIGWRSTKVMTLDHKAIYIPNALFNQIIIGNPNRMTHRRIDAIIGIRYEDAALLKEMVRSIEMMLRQHPKIDQRELVMAHLTNFGPSSLDINIYCFTKVTQNPHWRDVQQDIFFKIIEIVQAHEAQFAYPTVTTHIPQGIAIQGELNS